MKLLVLDESGDHGLKTIDPHYPVFVLGGVIVEEQYHNDELTSRLNQFKRVLFGREDIILRTATIARQRAGFEQLKDPRVTDAVLRAPQCVDARSRLSGHRVRHSQG